MRDDVPWVSCPAATLRAMPMLRSLSRALFLSLVLASGVPAADLFVEQAPVADEAAETRNAALSQMLLRVLVRVSGNAKVVRSGRLTAVASGRLWR